mmetsp:Transcript_32527/g.76608  ORF Transcript_32527/g.76608 Transcript_32527/m.76608 type:complete len:216 (+) Transcript_32527:738-1385(+)
MFFGRMDHLFCFLGSRCWWWWLLLLLWLLANRLGHSKARCPFSPQIGQYSFSSLRVPLRSASSRSCRCLCTFFSSSMTTSICSIMSVAASTDRWSSPVMTTWSGSSSLSVTFPSRRPRAPSLTDPRPRMAILHPVFFSSSFCVLPRGPMMSPIKLYWGCSSMGIRIFLVRFRLKRQDWRVAGLRPMSCSRTSWRSEVYFWRQRTDRVFLRFPSAP